MNLEEKIRAAKVHFMTYSVDKKAMTDRVLQSVKNEGTGEIPKSSTIYRRKMYIPAFLSILATLFIAATLYETVTSQKATADKANTKAGHWVELAGSTSPASKDNGGFMAMRFTRQDALELWGIRQTGLESVRYDLLQYNNGHWNNIKTASNFWTKFTSQLNRNTFPSISPNGFPTYPGVANMNGTMKNGIWEYKNKNWVYQDINLPFPTPSSLNYYYTWSTTGVPYVAQGTSFWEDVNGSWRRLSSPPIPKPNPGPPNPIEVASVEISGNGVITAEFNVTPSDATTLPYEVWQYNHGKWSNLKEIDALLNHGQHGVQLYHMAYARDATITIVGVDNMNRVQIWNDRRGRLYKLVSPIKYAYSPLQIQMSYSPTGVLTIVGTNTTGPNNVTDSIGQVWQLITK